MKVNFIIAICCFAVISSSAEVKEEYFQNRNSQPKDFYSNVPKKDSIEKRNAENISIYGKILDAQTKQPLESSSISIKGKMYSSISNEDGAFEMTIPYDANDTVEIARLGYKKKEYGIAEMKQDTFFLQEDTEVLQTVLVRPDLTANEIIKKAIDNIPNNYPNEPFVLEGLYRETEKENDNYVSLVEATVSVYDDDYKAPFFKNNLQERVALNEIRKSYRYVKKKYTNPFDRHLFSMNWLEGLLNNNSVRYLKNPLNKGREFTLDSTTTLDNNKVYVISAKPVATVWVKVENFAIMKILWNNEMKSNTKDFNDSLAYVWTLVRYEWEFKEHNGKMFAHYFNHTIKEHDINITTKKTVALNEYFHELYINKVIDKPIKKNYDFNSLSRKTIADQSKKYNPAFWKDYFAKKKNLPNQQVIEDLEKEIPLEEQFLKQK